MAMRVEPLLIASDVSKASLETVTSAQPDVQSIKNDAALIRRWIRGFSGPVALAVEATNTYHMELVEQAHARGWTVYVVDGLRLKRYRESVGVRAKTDATDARLLLRYLRNERADLRAWTPPPAGYREVQRLLRQRAAIVQTRERLGQALAGSPELKTIAAQLRRTLGEIERKIATLLRQHFVRLGWQADLRRCKAIEGVGDIVGMALAWIFRRGHFKSSDAFIAFIGMDVRARDSGTFRGKRKLSKHGDPEMRRLLYMAAMTACRSTRWAPFYQRDLQRGMAKTQALVALARKLARIAFALLKNQTEYRPPMPKTA
jgi:transposase